MTNDTFRRQIALISEYARRLGDVVGLNDCTCDECNERKRELSLILGEYGAEYATSLTISVLQESINVRKLERKLDNILAVLGERTQPAPTFHNMHNAEYDIP